ncbi:hypothetical protein C1H46_045062 [Malus baccata]|uniref:Uncharacterized protein n=1 Tax=Malus baccata TaxID=106549 RepID=A0A540K5A7_MALBA|nr:hypothetical protein C1H46_045062 [Malus baccata]
MWEEMGLVRVYTKPQGQQPDFGDPVVLSAEFGEGSQIRVSVGYKCKALPTALWPR